MGTNPRIFIALLVFAGLLLLSTSPAKAQDPMLMVDEEVGIGEVLLVTVTAGNRSANVTLSVDAPAGHVFATTVHLYEHESRSFTIAVTREWDFGRASVSATFEIGNMTVAKIVSVEIICRSGCLTGLITESVSAAMAPVWYLLIPTFIIMLLYVGHLSAAYRLENAEDSWVDVLRSVVRPIRRSSIRISMLDKGGYIPNDEMAQLRKLYEGVAIKIPAALAAEKKFRKEAKFLIARKDRRLKELRKLRAKRAKYEKQMNGREPA